MHGLLIQSKSALTFIVATAVLPTMIVRAQADNLSAIAGVWALDKGACKLASSDYDDRLRIDANGKNGGAESSCSASGIVSGGSKLTFRNTCSSEGERFKSTVTVDIASPDRITWKDGNQPAISYVRCEGGKGGSPKANGSNSTPASFGTGSFNLSSHGYSATITTLTGPDTSEARMTGKVTRADAEEECERNSPGGEGLKPKALQKCINATLSKESGKEYVAKADCKARSIAPHFGRSFTIVGVDQNGSARIRDARKRDYESSSASGGPSIQDQFEKLCPATFKRFKPS